MKNHTDSGFKKGSARLSRALERVIMACAISKVGYTSSSKLSLVATSIKVSKSYFSSYDCHKFCTFVFIEYLQQAA